MGETLTRVMQAALQKMAEDDRGRVNTFGKGRPHRRTLEALVARGLATWVPAFEGGSAPVQAEITEAGRRALHDPGHEAPAANRDGAPALDPSQGAPG